MKAIVYHTYGSPDVLHLEEVEKPAPEDDEVLIKVHAAALNASDWRLMRADPFLMRPFIGLLKPKQKILGADVAGQIEAVGRNVKRFQPGDEVFGDLSDSGRGGFAEYVCARENDLVLKPANLTFEQAAAAPFAGVTALQALRTNGKIKAGQKVLINGASGGVGTFAVQIARAFGAEVTAVCSTRNVEMVRSIGADHVIDYTKEDFTRNGQQYDLILAANGYQPLSAYRRALRPGGIYVMSGGKEAQMYETMFLGTWISMTGDKKMINMIMGRNLEDLTVLKELLETGKIISVIDRRYPLTEVPQAMRYIEEGHARGKIVITIE